MNMMKEMLDWAGIWGKRFIDSCQNKFKFFVDVAIFCWVMAVLFLE